MNRPLQSDVSDMRQIANFADRSNERGQTLLRKADGRSSIYQTLHNTVFTGGNVLLKAPKRRH